MGHLLSMDAHDDALRAKWFCKSISPRQLSAAGV